MYPSVKFTKSVLYPSDVNLYLGWSFRSVIFSDIQASKLIAKGQLISKAINGLLTSPKKWMDEFVLFAFLLLMANKSNSSVCFLGESMARQSAFRFYLTFTKVKELFANWSHVFLKFKTTVHLVLSTWQTPHNLFQMLWKAASLHCK